MKKQLRKNKFWEVGYFVRTVGDGVTAQSVQQYIARHRSADHGVGEPDDIRSLFADE